MLNGKKRKRTRASTAKSNARYNLGRSCDRDVCRNFCEDVLSQGYQSMNIEIQDFTHVMAGLNSASVICLSLGYWFIKQGSQNKHRACMVAALIISALFLALYVIYKANSGFAKFGGEGGIRPIYFSILFVHILGAIAITPLVPLTVYRAWRGRFGQHRQLARWTYPLWMYVGISGVVVYVMAVHFFPSQAL